MKNFFFRPAQFWKRPKHSCMSIMLSFMRAELRLEAQTKSFSKIMSINKAMNVILDQGAFRWNIVKVTYSMHGHLVDRYSVSLICGLSLKFSPWHLGRLFPRTCWISICWRWEGELLFAGNTFWKPTEFVGYNDRNRRGDLLYTATQVTVLWFESFRALSWVMWFEK